MSQPASEPKNPPGKGERGPTGPAAKTGKAAVSPDGPAGARPPSKPAGAKPEAKAAQVTPARQARLEAQRKRLRARRRKQLVVWGLVAAVVLGTTVFFAARALAFRAEFRRLSEAAGCTPIPIQKHEDQGVQHVDPGAKHAKYNSNPPSSGPHYVALASWGVIDPADPPVEVERTVHNLEHGGIVIHYNKAKVSEAELQKLEELVESYPNADGGSGVVLYPSDSIAKLDKPVALAAWSRTQVCDKVSIPQIRGFIKLRCGKGPEKFPLGC
ncbi:MAG: DUF3105 domain-containing protein [Actinomycetota bacterium]